MRVEKWDILMHRLLTEKKEKQLKEKAFAGKKELDNDEDGVPKWADKDDSDSKVGSKGSKKKKGKGKIPAQLKMHIKKKKSKLDEAIERLENILINEQVSVVDDIENHEHFDYDSGDIEASIRFTAPTDINFKRMVNDKIRSGEFNPRQDVASAPEYQYWVEQVKNLNTKLSNISKVKKVQSDLVIIVIGDSKEPILQFKDKIEDNKQEVDKLGGNYLIVKGSGVIGDFSKKPLEKGEMNKYAISFGLKKLTDQSFIEGDEEISAPGYIGGGRVQEIIRRIEKMLLEELSDSMLDEYGDDRHPPIGDTDEDDFEYEDMDLDDEDEDDFEDEDMDLDDEDDFEDEDMDLDDEDDYDDDEEDFMEEGLEDSSESESNIEKIDREDYRRETASTDQSVEPDELIEALKGTKFESMQCLDPSSYSQVIKFTDGPSDGNSILPMKKTDDYLYFKTNEKSNGVYYKIPLAESEEEGVEYLSEAEVKKKKPRLGKVTRNPSGSKKKFHVYVKCGGRVKKISFGDPGLSIKRDSTARRKNFRARHKCDKPAGKDRCTARYWSCYQWRAGKKVEGE